jgi:hypothetical protein
MVRNPWRAGRARHGFRAAAPRVLARVGGAGLLGGPARPGLARGFGLLGAGPSAGGEQLPGRVQHTLGELPLLGQDLHGEAVGAARQLLRLRQLAGERKVQVGKRGRHRAHGLDRLGDGLLALADGLQDLGLHFLAHVADIGHGSSSCCLLTILSKQIDLSSEGEAGVLGEMPSHVPECYAGLCRRRCLGCSAAATGGTRKERGDGELHGRPGEFPGRRRC